MENQSQKWVNLAFVGASFVLGFIVFHFLRKVTGAYDLEARIRNLQLLIPVFSVLLGAVTFLVLYRHGKAQQFMNEVVVELGRVTWPGQRETASATFLVVIMVLISGVVLGFLDYLWTVVIQWVLS